MKKSIWTGESLDGLFKQDIFLTDVMERNKRIFCCCEKYNVW